MEKIQLLLSSGLIIYLVKSIIEFYIRREELRNKTFYEIKTKKILELHKKIVAIQSMLDRGSYPLNQIYGLVENEKKSIGKIRYEMDLDFWESEFYFNTQTCKYIKELIKYLMYFSTPEFINEHPLLQNDIQIIIKKLLRQLKREIK